MFLRLLVDYLLHIFLLVIVIVSSAYFYLIYQMIREQRVRSTIGDYFDQVEAELTSMQAGMKNPPVKSYGSPKNMDWNPRSPKKEITCAAADKVILETRKLGYNFIIAGAASDPAALTSVNGWPMIVMILDLNLLPQDFIAQDKEIEMTIPHDVNLSHVKANVVTTWLACAESFAIITRLLK